MRKEIKNNENYLNKKTGFSAPCNYFDSLEDAISLKITEENLSKETAFKVPETYLDGLEDSILGKLIFKEKEGKMISFKQRILKFIPIATAASIILFIGLNSFVFKIGKEFTLDSISDTEIEYWLNVNMLINNDIGLILEEDLLEEDEFYFTNIKDESIEDYMSSIENISLFNEIN